LHEIGRINSLSAIICTDQLLAEMIAPVGPASTISPSLLGASSADGATSAFARTIRSMTARRPPDLVVALQTSSFQRVEGQAYSPGDGDGKSAPIDWITSCE
jgi:hypothetical protein